MRRNLFILLVLLLLIGAVIWVIMDQRKSSTAIRENEEALKNITRTEVPRGTVVPNKGDKVPENVAPPQVVGTAGNNTTASFREFTIIVENNTYTPNTVIAKKKDTVRINFTSRDRNYQFTQPELGFKVNLPQNQTTPITFDATGSGKFTFYCESCGGPDKGPVGYLIVTE